MFKSNLIGRLFIGEHHVIINSFQETKLEELNQSIQMDSIEMNREIMKNQRRVYASLANVNARLEMEVVKLKATLNEKTLRLSNLEKKQQTQNQEIKNMLDCMKNSNKQHLLNNFNVDGLKLT